MVVNIPNLPLEYQGVAADIILAEKGTDIWFSFKGNCGIMTNKRLFLQPVAHLYYKAVHRTTAHGLDKLPDGGPYIVASNHVSNHDPILLGTFLNHRIRFMAKEELFRVPILRFIVNRLGAFPVRRGGIGIGPIRHALWLLNWGDVVGIFPEGTRIRGGRQPTAKSGVGFIATKANHVPIVPVAICVEQRGWSGNSTSSWEIPSLDSISIIDR